jgi:hypothetical protein
VHLERDVWILMQSISPKDAAAVIAEKSKVMGDPDYRAIYLEYDAAFDWSPDDPRLGALADRTRRWFANWERRREDAAPVKNLTVARLAATWARLSSPAWDRLAEMARAGEAGG